MKTGPTKYFDSFVWSAGFIFYPFKGPAFYLSWLSVMFL